MNKKMNKKKKLTTKLTTKLTLKQKQKIVDEWRYSHGAASFDIKKKDIILHDGGLFSVEKYIKYLPRHRLKKIKEGSLKGGAELVEMKGPKVKHEFYDAYLWFEDLDGTISYLRSMKSMLNKIGYKTSFKRGKKNE